MPPPWKTGNPGDPCCETYPPPPCDVDIAIKVIGCGFSAIGDDELPDIAVELYDSDGTTLLDSGVTVGDASGGGSLTLTASLDVATVFPKTLYIKVPAYCGFAEKTQSIVLLFCADRTATVYLEAATGYRCTSCCKWPLQEDITFECEAGTFTLSMPSGITGLTWSGWVSFSGDISNGVEDAIDCTCPPGPGAVLGYSVNELLYTTGTIDIWVTLECNGYGQMPLLILSASDTMFVPIKIWYGQIGCESCAWCYDGGPGNEPAGSWSNTKVNGGIASSATCGCESFAASGTAPDDSIADAGITTCDDFTDPTPDPCPLTITNPIGAWAAYTT
jgi:hypothetical protein